MYILMGFWHICGGRGIPRAPSLYETLHSKLLPCLICKSVSRPHILLSTPCSLLAPLQVYNETICDLLQPSGQLALREDSQKGVVVSGLSQHQVLHCTVSNAYHQKSL